MARLAEVRAAHPVKDRAEYDEAYAEAELAGRIAAMAYGMRVAAGLSQSELAKRMGTSQPAIARLENAGSMPGIEFLARLAASTGVELSLVASGVAEVRIPEPIVQSAIEGAVVAGSAPGHRAPPRKRSRQSLAPT